MVLPDLLLLRVMYGYIVYHERQRVMSIDFTGAKSHEFLLVSFLRLLLSGGGTATLGSAVGIQENGQGLSSAQPLGGVSRLHFVEHDLYQLDKGSPGSVLIDWIGRGDMDVIQRAEYLEERLLVYFHLPSGYKGQKSPDYL